MVRSRAGLHYSEHWLAMSSRNFDCSTNDQKRLDLLVQEIASKNHMKWANLVTESSLEMNIVVKRFNEAIRIDEGRAQVLHPDSDRTGSRLIKKACLKDKNRKIYTPNPSKPNNSTCLSLETPQGMVLLNKLRSIFPGNNFESLQGNGDSNNVRVEYSQESVLPNVSETIEPTIDPTITATRMNDDTPLEPCITIENHLYRGPILIGRASYSTIQIGDERVSGRHALIQFMNDRFTITRLENTKIEVQVNRFQLKPGQQLDLCKADIICIGPSYYFTVNDVSHAVPRRTYYTLVVGNDQVNNFQCYFPEFDIGRGSYCNINVSDEEVSKIHVAISRSESLCFQLLGRNSISINGSPCSAANPFVVAPISQDVTIALSRKSLVTLKSY